jgi:hypothetical protein
MPATRKSDAVTAKFVAGRKISDIEGLHSCLHPSCVIRHPSYAVQHLPSVVRRPPCLMIIGGQKIHACMYLTVDTLAAKSMHVLRESSTSCALDFDLISRYLDA